MRAKKPVALPPIDQPFEGVITALFGFVRHRFIQIVQAWYPGEINYALVVRKIPRIAKIIERESNFALNATWIRAYLETEFTAWWDKQGYKR